MCEGNTMRVLYIHIYCYEKTHRRYNIIFMKAVWVSARLHAHFIPLYLYVHTLRTGYCGNIRRPRDFLWYEQIKKKSASFNDFMIQYNIDPSGSSCAWFHIPYEWNHYILSLEIPWKRPGVYKNDLALRATKLIGCWDLPIIRSAKREFIGRLIHEMNAYLYYSINYIIESSMLMNSMKKALRIYFKFLPFFRPWKSPGPS